MVEEVSPLSVTAYALPPSALRHGFATPRGEGMASPHPPPFPKFLLVQPRITAVPLPPSGGTSASDAGSLPVTRGRFPDVVHCHKKITNVVDLPRKRGRGTIAMISSGFVCLGGDGGGGFRPLRHRLRGATFSLTAWLCHPEGEGMASPHPPPFPKFLLAQVGITEVPLPRWRGRFSTWCISNGNNQRNIPSTVKRHFRQRCWLPARNTGKVPDVVRCRKETANVAYLPRIAGEGDHRHDQQWFCMPRGRWWRRFPPSSVNAYGIATFSLTAWLCHPEGGGKIRSASWRSCA
jgi:hypothetical protein